MPQSSREIVTRCLKFDCPERIPRDLWLLPWAEIHEPETVRLLRKEFSSDFATSDYFYPPSKRVKGDPYKAGQFTDEWGCVFRNIQDGIIGEVRDPIIKDISDWKSVTPPYEQLPESTSAAYDKIKRFYDSTDKFVMSNCCPRPWERYQFLRGTESALMDVMIPDEGFKDLIGAIHDFYLKEMEFWAKSEVDALLFMDDWGSQNQLLIHPDIWREQFKPLYREYCDLAHAEGKFVFMHSDGYITDIFEDLIEIGVDAINSQLFCMDIAELGRRFKGRITFWGEIDRQHVLPSPDPEVGRKAVHQVIRHLYDPSGGLIAQFEFGPGAKPDTALAVTREWLSQGYGIDADGTD
ncbi:methyltransferase [candidate division LCP-89 bacterium B3_LCP]|uniref:Methyltransferase n=1 Tax=candidate division LCP-89 bacterium B3_LCP TaxID=2012998 RepID=A0A532USL6_UNCL8|nr:MAG: methyltransferase [candidate division LCP-89 bacterium B3_LCP]